jgi:hypothetical protein
MSYEAVGFDYIEEEREMEDFDNEFEDENYGRDGGELGLDDYDMLTKVTDTTAAQARKGKDIQGIPWDRLNITREKYRLTRLEQYRNYENVPSSGESMDKECKPTQKGGNYFDFFHNTRSVKPTILHFQVCELFKCCLAILCFVCFEGVVFINPYLLYTHTEMKFLTVHRCSFKFFFSFLLNYKALVPASNTMSPSQVNCYEI